MSPPVGFLPRGPGKEEEDCSKKKKVENLSIYVFILFGEESATNYYSPLPLSACVVSHCACLCLSFSSSFSSSVLFFFMTWVMQVKRGRCVVQNGDGNMSKGS